MLHPLLGFGARLAKPPFRIMLEPKDRSSTFPGPFPTSLVEFGWTLNCRESSGGLPGDFRDLFMCKFRAGSGICWDPEIAIEPKHA